MNFLSYSLLLFSFVMHLCASGQNSIAGRLLDDRTLEPIAFVNIKINQQAKGTVTNMEGEFTLSFEEESLRDSLVISHIGYLTRKFSITELVKTEPVTIRLKEYTHNLSGITVRPIDYLDDGEKIVSLALQSIPRNCNASSYVTKGFFRQIHREDNEYKRLIEAAITTYDPGIHAPVSDIQYSIPELRRSFDQRDLNNNALWNLVESSRDISKRDIKGLQPNHSNQNSSDIQKREQKFVSLRSFLLKDGIRTSRMEDKDDRYFGLLNRDFLKQHRFKLDTITSHDGDEVYVIKILPSWRSKEYLEFPRTVVVPVGKIYVRTSDYAILRFDYSYILNPNKKGSQDYDILMKTRGSGVMFSVSAKYMDHEGKIYLSSLTALEGDPLSAGAQLQKQNDSNFTKGYFFLERSFIVTEIITEDKYVSGSLATEVWNDNLYTKVYTYNEAFWENYTILKATSREEKLISDLQKKGDLNEQFKRGQ